MQYSVPDSPSCALVSRRFSVTRLPRLTRDDMVNRREFTTLQHLRLHSQHHTSGIFPLSSQQHHDVNQTHFRQTRDLQGQWGPLAKPHRTVRAGLFQKSAKAAANSDSGYKELQQQTQSSPTRAAHKIFSAVKKHVVRPPSRTWIRIADMQGTASLRQRRRPLLQSSRRLGISTSTT
jgi:hypothetical protein